MIAYVITVVVMSAKYNYICSSWESGAQMFVTLPCCAGVLHHDLASSGRVWRLNIIGMAAKGSGIFSPSIRRQASRSGPLDFGRAEESMVSRLNGRRTGW